jgi:hypothetical protein
MQNQWTFIGECINITTRPAGKANITTAILRRVDGDGENSRETLAAAEIWNARGPAIGDVVVACGTVNTREYQGKYYTSLRCERWHRIALAEYRSAGKENVGRPGPGATTAPGAGVACSRPPAPSTHQQQKADAYQPQGETTDASTDSCIPF